MISLEKLKMLFVKYEGELPKTYKTDRPLVWRFSNKFFVD